MKMKKGLKRFIATITGLILLLTIIFLSGLPWPASARHTLRRITVKIETRVAAWRDEQPRIISISGKLTGSGAFAHSVKGAQVVALESTSGYGAMTDGEGRFLLPHLPWYPGATYNLIVTADSFQARHLKVSAPPTFAQQGIIEVGELRFEDGREVDKAERPVRYLKYDGENDGYYKELFDRLTADSRTDHQRIDAINKYVASRHNPKEDAWSFSSARQIIERGAPHCSNLAFAMAIISAAGRYPARTVHTSDAPDYKRTHVAVEVYYDDAWHLYDPTYGVFFLNEEGIIASYEELRLKPGLVTAEAFKGLRRGVIRSILEWMPNALNSGLNQVYEVNKDEFWAVW